MQLGELVLLLSGSSSIAPFNRPKETKYDQDHHDCVEVIGEHIQHCYVLTELEPPEPSIWSSCEWRLYLCRKGGRPLLPLAGGSGANGCASGIARFGNLSSAEF